MLRRLLSRLALRAISSDDPVIDVEYSQNEAEGVWKATFALRGSDREWSTSIGFNEGFEANLVPELPSSFLRTDFGYATPLLLKSNCPVEIVIRSQHLRSISGTVFVTFEAKGRIGGTGISRFIPIGFADPALLERYAASVRRNREARSSTLEG